MLLALLLIIAIKLSDATIKVNFTYDEFNQYTASVAGQEFSVDERGTKVFGKHPPGQKSSDVKVIDCADKGNHFEQYPPMLSSIFGEAEVLLLQNSGLKRLAYESFIHAKKVKIMMFGKDNFVIEPAVFRDCTELEVLKFDDLDLSNVNVEAFEGIESLKILSIKNCEISRMEPQLLEPLENLIELHITENPMKIPPISAIQRMTHLRVLNLSGNKLTHLHDDLFKHKDFLQYVDVSKNVIHEVERDLLLHWPGHATINMEGNTCIDKKFDHIGTDSLTLLDVANVLMPCFNDEQGFVVDKDDSKEDISASVEYSTEISNEKNSTESNESSIKSSETREKDGRKSSETSKEKKSKILEKLVKISKSIESNEEKKAQEIREEKSSESNEEKKSFEENKEKISKYDESREKSVEVKEKEKSNKKSEDSDEVKSIEIKSKSKEVEKKDESKESKSSESAEVKLIKSSKESAKEKNKSKENSSEEKLAKENKSSESSSDEKSTEKENEKKIAELKEKSEEKTKEEEEVVATISPFEFIEQDDSSTTIFIDLSTTKPENEELEMEEIEVEEKLSPEIVEGEKVEETSTKKKKIKVKKGKKTTTEAPAITSKFIEIPEPATNFLHPYEQAWCRFFIDADNNYNCVLENVTSEVKRINADHLSGYDNSKVNGLHLRQSVLVRLPLIFFDTFENLEHLSVENTNIKQLDEDTVKDGCGKLKSISLKNNKIRRLERHALKECENLESIDLTGNPIEYLEGDIFNYNPKLSITMGSLKIVSPALTSF